LVTRIGRCDPRGALSGPRGGEGEAPEELSDVKMAEEMEKGLKAYGHPVMRVRIDPVTFPIWCAAHSTTPDRQGRKDFIAAAVKERYGDQT